MKYFLSIFSFLTFLFLNGGEAVITLEPALKAIQADAQAKQKTAQAELKAIEAQSNAKEKAIQAQIEGELRTQLATMSAMLKGANGVINGVNGMTGGFFAGSDILLGIMQGYSSALSALGGNVKMIVEKQKINTQTEIQNMQIALQKNNEIIKLKMNQQNALLEALKNSFEPSVTLKTQMEMLSQALGSSSDNTKYIAYNTIGIKAFEETLKGFETWLKVAMQKATLIDYNSLTGQALFQSAIYEPALSFFSSMGAPFGIFETFTLAPTKCPYLDGLKISACLMEQVIQNYRKIVALIQNKLNDADFQNIAYLNGINEEIKTLKGSVDLNALIEVAILNAENHLNYIENLERKADLWEEQLKLERETTARNIASSKVIVK
ncbi:cag pathogenicity island type IV secretion system translocation protein CagI [Helicobacter pylori]|uniref:Cag pathogenicity island type IV secretion system translocation protein CagI n=1 Tax=Helicobacter pylori TaxID=210 RepID=A0AAE7PB14_HELPX|nr:cag pathogenicity island type IV secretion system translocation protein CagI [Helicobacter pylori]QQW93734.1 cag pathogenicity island type IV secretion system translocation protein CagI [Helicobacter pylori]QQX49700.1 cag pathogenicity island type IV secretion system translocation protein CagI [Helicobacter pylori]